MPNQRRTSGHSPVSNIPDDPDFPPIFASETESPEVGQDGEAESPEDDGKESVEVPLSGLMESAPVIPAPDTSKLRNIGEASYGSPPPRSETVHGRDDRVLIQNTDVYPWRVHASLLITARDNSRWIGTGWFVSPHTLITAGHVVHIKNSRVPGRDGWVRSIIVMPGRNASHLPYDSAVSTVFHSVEGWTRRADPTYDYGAIVLPTPLGNQTGWMGFGVFTDDTLKSSVANISGYPGDKPDGTQWYDSREIASVDNRKVYYDVDTAGGQSGSAVYRIENGKRFAVAIHAYGGARFNSGTRINTPVFNNIKSWKS